MLTSNSGKTNSQTSKYWTPLSYDSPFTWIFHTPCVKKKTFDVLHNFVFQERRSNCCESMYIAGDQVKFTYLFLRTAVVHLLTRSLVHLPYLEFTSSGTFHSGISEIYVTKNHKSNPAQKCLFNFHKPTDFLEQHAVTRGTFTKLLKLNQLTAVDKA